MKPLIIFLLLALQSPHWQVLKTSNAVNNRSECGLAASGGKLYLMGGDGDANFVEVFDPATGLWTKKGKAPAPFHHFQPVSYQHNIYVLQGFSGGNYPEQGNLAGVLIYDTEKDSWQKGAAIDTTRRRAAAGAALYKGKIYLVCGIKHGHSSGTNNLFDVYDPRLNTWTALPDAPHIRDHCTAAVVGDKLYIAGGRNTSYHEPGNFMSFFSKTVLEVDCFDFITGTWSTLDAKLPLGTGGGAMVNLNGTLYYMGGERATATEQNRPRKNVYAYNPATDHSWAAMDDLNFARNGMSAAVLNQKIYVFGGVQDPGGPPPPPNGPPNNAGMPNPPPPGGGQHKESPSPLEVFGNE